MPVDASIAANAGVKPLNPLETLGQVAQIANVSNQNKLFQQQYQTNLGLGNIFKEAVGPDGKVDISKVNELMSQDPSVTVALPEAMQQAQSMQHQQIQIDTDQLANLNSHFNTMRGMFGSLLAKPTPLTQKDLIQMGGDMIANKMASPQQVAAELANAPQDDAGIRSLLKQMVVQTMDGQQKLSAISPTPTAVNAGGTTNFVQLPQIGAPVEVGQMQNTLSPEAVSGRVPTFQNGQPGSVSMGSLAPNLTAVQPNGQSGGAAPPASGGIGLGASQGAPQGDFLPTGPGLGQSAAADVAGTNSAQQGVDLQKAADQVPQQKSLLQALETSLQNFTSGPTADWKRVGASLVNANNPFGNAFNPKSIASQEEFNKQAAQLAQSQFQALGGTGTDAKLDSAMHTSPNEALSKMGNKAIIDLLKGNADALAVKNQEWQKYQQAHGPQSYGQFSTEFNQIYNPRVFQFQYMTPAERQDAVKAMSKPELTQFKRLYNFAAAQGWLQNAPQ